MEASVSLHITPKGLDELDRRAYKLSTRKRSVLILLAKPQTVAELTRRSVFQEDIVEDIQILVRDGFIALERAGAGPAAAPETVAAVTPLAGELHLGEEVMLSEAKFLLVDFCVDSFGTQSQAFVDEIRTCRSAKDLDVYLRTIVTATRRVCPHRFAILASVVNEINATA